MFSTTPSNFKSEGLNCAATLYLPQKVQRPPVIIMGHGVAAERSFALPNFAEVFANVGYAVFLFDYRNLGESEGQPRNWVSHWRHGKDWDNAIAHVQQLPQIDTNRIILWGSSFGGGHVIAAGSRHQNLKAIIAQVPFVDSLASLRCRTFSYVLKSTAALTLDLLYQPFGRAYEVPVVAAPNQFAVMNTEESLQGYMNIVPPESKWKNSMPARFFLSATLFRPTATAHKINCPALILAGKKDSLIPVADVKKLAHKIPQGQYIELDCDHFEPYGGTAFQENIGHQLAFLKNIVSVENRT